MKQIGIKLADGSFYPIMEEGKPVKKTLGLTTVNDNQTRVLVDVYRSKTGTMEDAEYIDTLQIDNLVAHPNGTADINLNIGLDENNKLHAEMIDPETGGTSNANVTLVSRTLEERLEPTNYDVKLGENGAEPVEDSDDFSIPDFDEIAPADEDDFSNEFSELEAAPEETAENAEENNAEGSTAGKIAAGAALGGLAAAAAMSLAKENPESENKEEPASISEETNNSEEDFNLPDFSEENPLEEPIEEEENNSIDDLANDEFDLPDFDENNSSDEEISIPVADSEIISEDSTISADDTTDSVEDFDLPDFDDSDSADAAENSEPSAEDSTISADEETKTESSNAGAFVAGTGLAAAAAAALAASSKSSEQKNNNIEENSETNEPDEIASDETITADDDSGLSGFDLPDFDTDSDSNIEDSEKSVIDDDDFFNSLTAEDSFENSENEDASTLVNDNTPSHGIKFDGLYDKETASGNSSEETEESESDDVKKKTRTPVIICIICAIICVIATLLILFVVPSKYNLLHKTPKTQEETTPIVQEEPKPEEEIKPVVIEAKEDEIVVAEEPEQVIPEPAPEPEVAPKDITYKIKWGDTLWDIADAYYKNPWNYKKIARYNNIKNPDYIISGTTITIPAK